MSTWRTPPRSRRRAPRHASCSTQRRYPSRWQQEIRSAYEQLVGKDPQAPVAVRSSATAEDTAETSFAGMNETFLNIRGADAVDRRRAPLLAFAVRRAHHLLPGPERLWAGRHGHRRRRAAPARLNPRRRDVHRQPRHRRAWRAGHRGLLRPGRGGRLGLGLARSLRGGEGHARDPPPRGPSQGAGHRVRPRRRYPAAQRSPRRRPCGRSSPTRRSWRWPSSAGASRSTTALRRTPSGRSTPTARCGCCRAARSPRSTTRPPRAPRQPSPHEPQALLLRGLGGAPGSASGAARVLTSLADAASLNDGDVLVTHMTSPDWLPLMRRAAAIVTDSGGMTCHAAIVSRELGIPCVVGTGEATRQLRDGEIITVDATRGVVLEGARASEPAQASSGERSPRARREARSAAASAVTATQILVNLSEPSQVERVKDLPVDGVGLLRAEMMVLEALAGRSSRGRCSRRGAARTSSTRMAEGLTTFAAGLRAAAGHLSHDRLPHQRVLRAARRRALRAARGQPDDRLPRGLALHARARHASRSRWRPCAGCGTRAAQPARDAAVRAQHARAAPLPRADRRVGPARSARLRAVGDGRGAIGAVQPQASTPRSA